MVKRQKTKVKFDDGAVFLAACSSGDTDEVLKLLHRGADINYANVDGPLPCTRSARPAAALLTLRALVGLPLGPLLRSWSPEAGGRRETPCRGVRGGFREGGRERAGGGRALA